LSLLLEAPNLLCFPKRNESARPRRDNVSNPLLELNEIWQLHVVIFAEVDAAAPSTIDKKDGRCIGSCSVEDRFRIRGRFCLFAVLF
jgi:hypothetical protein